ncbi:polysaccharide biosynthesis tyrosine autokinase [Psychrobacter sp. APC 3426]|uniref:polysaccharide biosynthesis tyrosine autokinase n=1 Tax=Psychrobacter sp. APC 3426 TaxID=3035177 RepID=UPI0025B3B939|nr:polysaccharide biosynthesis tyrosine autokinase [Psychrobacter sp. APC 3426]MDN3398522.1 polysaccharide biosynthesis tyrosine autokinase [Psychrobacter sp. APC 3426]
MDTNSKDLSRNDTNKDNDLLGLFLVLLRGWKIIVLFAILGLIIGVLYARYENPTFKSDALIQIDETSKNVSGLGSSVSELLPPDNSSTQAQIELIRSRMVLEPVVDRLNLDIRLSDPSVNKLDRIRNNQTNVQMSTADGVLLETNSGPVQIKQFDVSQDYLDKPFVLSRTNTGFVLSSGTEEFKGQLGKSYRFRGKNGLIEIGINELPTGDHPINITQRSLQITTDSINSALTVVEKGAQTGIIELSLSSLSQEQASVTLKQIVLSYMAQNQQRDSEQTSKTIQFMEKQIPELRKNLEASEAKFNSFREKSGTIDVGQEAGILLGEKAGIDSQLSELKLKKAELTTYYTEEHPLVIQINDQLRVLNDRKQQIKDTVNKLPEVQREFVTLSEDVSINREIYLTILKNYEQLKIVKAGQVSDARIIDLPINTYRTITPKKQLIMGLSTLAGALLGTLLVLIMNLLRNVVKDPERIESKTGVPVIATIPRSSVLSRLSTNKKAAPRMLAHVDNSSLTYEAIKSLRTSLILGMPTVVSDTKQAKVILVTGESPGVGKSFISANLSEVFAQLNKKVLVIDADMRLGELHKIFSMSQYNGLADYLLQDDSIVSHDTTVDVPAINETSSFGIENFIHPSGMEHIDFIPRGKHPINPASLLIGDRFSALLAKLKSQYDYIVIDSPPILAASDAMVLAQHADQILMVTRYDESMERQLTYAVKQMHKSNIQVDGVILNDVKQGLMSKYSYHYNYAYGNNQ